MKLYTICQYVLYYALYTVQRTVYAFTECPGRQKYRQSRPHQPTNATPVHNQRKKPKVWLRCPIFNRHLNNWDWGTTNRQRQPNIHVSESESKSKYRALPIGLPSSFTASLWSRFTFMSLNMVFHFWLAASFDRPGPGRAMDRMGHPPVTHPYKQVTQVSLQYWMNSMCLMCFNETKVNSNMARWYDGHCDVKNCTKSV